MQPYAASPPPAPPDALYRQNVFVPPGARSGEVPKPWVRNVKLACGIGMLVFFLAGLGLIIAGAASGRDGEALMLVGGAGFGLGYLFLMAYAAINLLWIYQIWSWLPPEQRHTKLWKKYISPGQALGFMLIPYFNIYWMFVVYLGLADALDRMRVSHPTRHASPKNLALAALIVPLVFFPAAPLLQFMLAKHIDEMAGEIQATRDAAIAQAARLGGVSGAAVG